MLKLKSVKPEEVLNTAIKTFIDRVYNVYEKFPRDVKGRHLPRYVRISEAIFDVNAYGYTLNIMLKNILDKMECYNTLERDAIYNCAIEFCDNLRRYYREEIDAIIERYTHNKCGFVANKSYLSFIKALRPRGTNEILSVFHSLSMKNEIVDLFSKELVVQSEPWYSNGVFITMNFKFKTIRK